MSTVLTSKRRSSHSKIKEESNNNLEVPNDSESSISNTLLSTNMKTVNGVLFEAVLPDEECRFYLKAYPNVRDVINRKTHCTVCRAHIGTAPAHKQSMRMHPILRVTHCTECHDFYNSGEFVRGDDGSELYCRWCGQGGEVYCCSTCPYVFCKLCIQSNLSASVVADIVQNENWECFNCAPKIIWPIRAQHWALMRYIDQRKNEISAMNIPELEKKLLMLFDHSNCCSLTKVKPFEMKNATTTTTLSKEVTEMVNRSNSTADNNSTSINNNNKTNNNTRKSLKHSKQSTNCLLTAQPNAKRFKRNHNNNSSNINNNNHNNEVVSTPDLVSMLTPDCQLTVCDQKSQPQPNQIKSGERTTRNASGLRILTNNQSNKYNNKEKKLRHVITPSQIVKQTMVTPPVSMALGTNTPFIHNINGYDIDLNYASTQQYYRLPNGQIIQVRRQNSHENGDSSSTCHVRTQKKKFTPHGGWRVVELKAQPHQELQQQQVQQKQQQEQQQHHHIRSKEFQQHNYACQQQPNTVTISTTGLHNNVNSPNNMVRIIRQQHHQQQAIPNIINHNQNMSTNQCSTVITPISNVTLKNSGIVASVNSINGLAISPYNSTRSTGQTSTIISQQQQQQQHLHHHAFSQHQQQLAGLRPINVGHAITVDEQQQYQQRHAQQNHQQQQQQLLNAHSPTREASNRIQASYTNISGQNHNFSVYPQISLRNKSNINNHHIIQQQVQHHRQPQQSLLPEASESGISKTGIMQYNFPSTPIGQARSHLQDRIHNTVDICRHIVTKLNALTNSNAYKQAKTAREVKELYIHKSYLLTYVVGRFKMLQDKCLADMRLMGFHHEADCLKEGLLAPDCGDDNNHSNAVTPLENSRFYKNEDRTENSNFEEVKDEIIVDYVDLLTEEEMVEE